MEKRVEDFFRQYRDDMPKGNFHRVISLGGSTELGWEKISAMIPNFPKGWYELARLPVKDRIEFTRDFWLESLPYKHGFSEFIQDFFSQVDDIRVFLTQKLTDSPFEAFFVYSMSGNSSFYRGALPASEEDLQTVQKLYPDLILPSDYTAFLRIHNGFWKTTDSTGIAPTYQLQELKVRFEKSLPVQDLLKTSSGAIVNPATLVPFYESFGMPFFQCFWTEWYPEEEMGNVYYCADTQTILFQGQNEASLENMSFPSFLDWLMFYLERIT